MIARRALVVDDSLTVRMDLVEALADGGFEVTGASSLAEARAVLAGASFDVVILDVRLGDGDGVDLLCELRRGEKEGSHTPVMMLSSEAEVRDRIRGLTTGADEYVGKPYALSYVVERARELTDAHRRSEVPQTQNRSVLVIDDSLSFRERMREALVDAGFRAVTAASGEEGLQRAAAMRPGLVIVDGQLPGIDGATVIRRMRLDAPLRRTPCIMITASDIADAELTAFEAGVDAFLHKRTPPEEIVARVASLISRAPPVASVRSSLAANKLLLVGAGAGQLADALRGEGFDVAFAATLDEAALVLELEVPACVLLDASSQPGGCSVLRDVVKRSTAVVALATDADTQLVIDCLAAGADEVVPIGTPMPALVARIRAQLRRKQADEEAARERDAAVARELAIADARAAERLAEARAELLAEIEKKNAELAAANAELEAFSYSVSHDLRAPLRAIEGFSRALEEDQGHLLEDVGRQHLARVFGAAARMRDLIDDLLALSRVTRAELVRRSVDLTALARLVVADLRARAGPSGGHHHRSGARGPGRRGPSSRGAREPHRERLEVQLQARANVHRGRLLGRRRDACLLRPRQRCRLRHGARREALSSVPAAAHDRGVRGNRDRSRDGSPDHHPTRGAHLGRVVTRGNLLLFHARLISPDGMRRPARRRTSGRSRANVRCHRLLVVGRPNDVKRRHVRP